MEEDEEVVMKEELKFDSISCPGASESWDLTLKLKNHITSVRLTDWLASGWLVS